jgi:hypothetical protein
MQRDVRESPERFHTTERLSLGFRVFVVELDPNALCEGFLLNGASCPLPLERLVRYPELGFDRLLSCGIFDEKTPSGESIVSIAKIIGRAEVLWDIDRIYSDEGSNKSVRQQERAQGNHVGNFLRLELESGSTEKR